MKKLPIGIQTFENLITEGYLYVDKTHFIQSLTGQGKYYFLSRPRRFGKSLLLSTIKAAYQGKKELFNGLSVLDQWDWQTIHPVIHISFGSGVIRDVHDLEIRFQRILENHASHYGLNLFQTDLRERFAELIHGLSQQFSHKVVILVDEYDKPILDNIERSDTALDIREELKNYYAVIKDADPDMQFVLITGVSKFSKVSLFSGLNNLKDITLDRRYSALCGYTQKELESAFADQLLGLDLAQVRKWYNGYSWLGEEVYNPFDILLYLDSRVFANYWFETGTPSFLIKLVHGKQLFIPDLDNLHASEQLLGSFDVDQVEPEALLFQTGYLTIQDTELLFDQEVMYVLGFPNHEVKKSFHRSIVHWYTGNSQLAFQRACYRALQSGDFDALRDVLSSLFASIPHDWYRKNQLSGYEGYYVSIVYAYFAALGLDVRPEETTNKGRIDLVIRFENRVFVIEFKVLELTAAVRPLEQIKARGYAEKFSGQEVFWDWGGVFQPGSEYCGI